jgi:hypothetical protein
MLEIGRGARAYLHWSGDKRANAVGIGKCFMGTGYSGKGMGVAIGKGFAWVAGGTCR